MASSPTTRARLSAPDRRKQLIGIGLKLLITTPIHQLSIDDVAAEAGISRSLLFHYFPTKRDYYAAVVRAASRRMLGAATPTDDVPTDRRLPALLEGLVAFITRRRDPYVTFVRGVAGGDSWVMEIHEETRAALVDLVLGALGRDPQTAEKLVRLQIRGWIAYAEELILLWTHEPDHDHDALVVLLERALHQLIRLEAT